MASGLMTARDDDPVHPNLDGIRFQATTDRSGIIAVATSAQTRPPVSYLPVGDAVLVVTDLDGIIGRLRAVDS